jgi:hypothetical protein
VAEAGSQTITEKIAHQACFFVDDLNGAFGAVGNAETASGAFLFIDGDDFAFHCYLQVVVSYSLPLNMPQNSRIKLDGNQEKRFSCI